MSVGVSISIGSRDGWLGKARVEAAAAIHGAPLYVMDESLSASHSAHRANVYTSH